MKVKRYYSAKIEVLTANPVTTMVYDPRYNYFSVTTIAGRLENFAKL